MPTQNKVQSTGLKRIIGLSTDAWLLSYTEDHLLTNREPRSDPGWFHPSALSTPCDRKLAFDFLGVPKKEAQITPKLLRIFHNGDMMHRRWQAYFRAMGILIGKEVKFEYPSPPIRGSMDAVIAHPVIKRPEVVELKSINDNGFKNLQGPKDDHLSQVNIYMAANDIPDGHVLYENKNDQNVKVYPVKVDITRWEQLQIRLMKIMKKLQKAEMPKPFIHDGCTQCPFFNICADFRLSEYVAKGN